METHVDHGFALVTGSGSGIGKAIALELAKSNFPVVVNDINEAAGEQAVAAISDDGGQAYFIPADVSDANAVMTMFDEAERQFGKLGILVNNAGTPGKFALLTDMADQDWRTNISVHIDGAFYCLREAARRMVNGGHIVSIASIAGLNGTIGSAAYAAAKAAVINLTKTAAKELAASGISVNAIAPGMVATPINQKLANQDSPFIAAALEGVPTNRMTDPQEIADLVSFLCQPANAITGQIIALDSGASLAAPIDRFMLNFLQNNRAAPKQEIG